MRVAVVGSSGFLGAAIVAQLQSNGDEAVAIAHRSPVGLSVDLPNDGDRLRRLLRGMEVVVHVAGLSGAVESNRRPRPFWDVNGLGTAVLLSAAADASVPRVVFASSRLVYGTPTALPVPEDALLQPASVYAATKLFGENLVRRFVEQGDHEGVTLRFTNPYGLWRRENGYNFASASLRALSEGGGVRLFGGGLQLRDYVHVEDCARAVVTSVHAHLARPFVIANIGSGTGVSIRDFALLAIASSGAGSVESAPWPPDMLSTESGSFVANIAFAKHELGFEPLISLADGIGQTISALSHARSQERDADVGQR